MESLWKGGVKDMAYMIGAILSLKDKNFSSTIKKSEKGVKKFKTQTKYAGNQVRKFGKSTKGSFNTVLKSAVGLAGAYVGIKAIKGFASSTMEAARAQIDAETKLQAVLKNTPGMAKDAYKHLQKYASQQQRIGVIGDEVQLAGMQQLATYQLQESSLKALSDGMNDLLAQQKGLNASQGDAVGVGNMVGKVMSGQLGALSRAGIIFNDAQKKILTYGTEQERAATLAEILQQNVGGVNKALAETDPGKIQRAKNIWGDYKEMVGKGVLKVQGKLAGWFIKYMPFIEKTTSNVIKGISKVSAKIRKLSDKYMPKIKTSLAPIHNKAIEVFSMIKSKGTKALQGIIGAFKDVKAWGVNTWQVMQEKVKEHQPTIEGVKGVLNDLKDKAIALKDVLANAFDNARPAIDYLKDNALPIVIDAIAGVVDKATDMYNFINDNWGALEPIVYGIAGAFAFYKGIMLVGTVIMAGWNIAAGIGAAVTTAFGTAMAILTSPITLIVVAIGGLIAVGVLLYKNWDLIKEKVGGVIGWIKEGFYSLLESAKEIGGGIANFFIRPINKLIEGVNKVKFDTPDWVPFIGGKSFGFNIPKIPEFALGTQYFSGGLARTDERGGEIKEYPSGTKIYPHDKSLKMAREEGKKEGQGYTFNIYCRGLTADEVVNEAVPKIIAAIENIK